MDNNDKINLLATDRRTFLAGLTGAGVMTTAPLQVLGNPNQESENWHQPRRCVFQQMPYVSFDGVGESYDAPNGSKSTRDYLDSISHEEYLRRHWFI